jgi:iron complex transport system substrate-binding protein
VYVLAGGEVAVSVGESVERGILREDVLLVDDGAGKTINVELLLSYAPDLVLASSDVPAQVSAAEAMRRAGIPAGCFRIECMEDYLSVLKIFSEITGNPEAYRKYGTDMQEQVQTLLQSLPKADCEKRILFIRAGSSARSTKAKTAEEHFACQMLKEMNTYNIAENARILLDGLSIEEILRSDPEIIFVTTMGDEAAAIAYVESLFATPTYQALTAVREGKYYFLPKELFQYKPNAEWYRAYSYLAELLYGTTYNATSE